MTPNLGMLKNWLNSKLVAIFNPFQIIEIIQEPALKSNVEKLPLKVNELIKILHTINKLRK